MSVLQKRLAQIGTEPQENGIFCCMNDHFISGDNQKYYRQKAILLRDIVQG